MSSPTKKKPEGLWLACENMEIAAKRVTAKQLEPFEAPIRICYESGVQVSTLPGKRHGTPDILLAALFLKKTLNDLRSTWVLLQYGYTSQAASVAASLFENALTVTCLAGNDVNTKKLQNNKSGDLPWKVQQLAKMLSQQWQEEARILKRKFDKEDYEKAWQEIYSGYKWLCKIKHPTIMSAAHDALSTSLISGEYVVMAAPDIRPEDIAVKATILAMAINRVYGAIRSFSFALECDTKLPEYKRFVKRMQDVA
ncbi:MAG: hypothetical protein MUO30_10025, partial [Anaerolineales bacterium]|nr:hypothetical protein [Anaerolineales bacterium]